jgi:putative zinc finger protein
MEHPDEPLAGYVDGSCSAEERREVEAHLAVCSQCRDELALARGARIALASLPEMEAPGLAAGGLDALRRAGISPVGEGPAEEPPQPVTTPAGVGAGDEVAARREAGRDEARWRPRWRVSWTALAGAAAVLALVAVVPLVLTRGGGSKSPSGLRGQAAASPRAGASYAPVLDVSSDYHQESIQALARRLGEQARSGALKEAMGSGAPAPSAQGPPARLAAVPAAAVVQCLIQATGLPADTAPAYLEVATYRGTPAYVAAVQTVAGSRSHLRVYAIGSQDCRFLYEADQPL